MSLTSVEQIVEDLGENIDNLETSLAPLLEQALSTTTSRLPLLDKAKINVLTTYAIESLLFSYLRLNGVDAKEHAVFRELTRVKAYFEKIKLAEEGPPKRSTALDKDAARRIIKHGLVGNQRLDKEKAANKRTADELNQSSQWGNANRFAGTAKRIRVQEDAKMVPVVRAAKVEETSSDVKSKTITQQEDAIRAEKKAARRQRRQQAALAKQSPSSDLPDAQSNAELSSVSTPVRGDGKEHSLVLEKADATDLIAHKMHKKKKKHRTSLGDLGQST